MKKTILSGSLIILFIVYGLNEQKNEQSLVITEPTPILAIASPTPKPSVSPVSTPTPTISPTPTANTLSPSPTPTPRPTPTPTPVPTATPVPRGRFKDGTYTGLAVTMFYGIIQEQVTVLNGFITTATTLQYPTDRKRSVVINNEALPILRSEVIQVQTGAVDLVSGATYTSQAFSESITSALLKAR